MSFKAVGQSVILSVTVNGSPIPTADDITWAKMDERSIPMPITHDRLGYLLLTRAVDVARVRARAVLCASVCHCFFELFFLGISSN